MPDAGVTLYINDVAGKIRYEDMFVGEFIPFVDANYRTRADRQYRGVSGLSTGGGPGLHPASPGDLRLLRRLQRRRLDRRRDRR